MGIALVSEPSAPRQSHTLQSVQCALCGQRPEPWLRVPTDWRGSRWAGPFRLWWCGQCQFGQLFPRPSARIAAAAYEVEQYYTHGNEGSRATAPRIPLVARVRDRLIWMFDRSTGLLSDRHVRALLERTDKCTICDVGCGDGALLQSLRAAGHRTIGVDPDHQARRLAGHRGVTVLDGTAEATPAELGAGRFDLVIMSHVLEHCIDPLGAIKNGARLLAPGGCLVIEVPNNAARGLSLAGAAWLMLDVPRHLNFFTGESLGRICEGAGLRVEETRYTEYARQFSGHWQVSEAHIDAALARFKLSDRDLRKARRRSWRLLAETAFARRKHKYDSVRVTASLKES
jgi:2-polyprenyl-3-methyl-5-hydroxy-6-metoxy-1,4-benzoquinol methylase